jgi:hypothetical protein
VSYEVKNERSEVQVAMTQAIHTRLHYKRAVVTFILAYLAITVLAVGLSISLEAIMHAPPANDIVHNPSYVLSEKFYPLLNLLVWTTFSWVYFKIRENAPGLFKEALALGLFWLALALAVDYVGFVLIKHPLSLSAHDFYIEQFPWIYLIYLVIFISPMCYAALWSRLSARSVA